MVLSWSPVDRQDKEEFIAMFGPLYCHGASDWGFAARRRILGLYPQVCDFPVFIPEKIAILKGLRWPTEDFLDLASSDTSVHDSFFRHKRYVPAVLRSFMISVQIPQMYNGSQIPVEPYARAAILSHMVEDEQGTRHAPRRQEMIWAGFPMDLASKLDSALPACTGTRDDPCGRDSPFCNCCSRVLTLPGKGWNLSVMASLLQHYLEAVSRAHVSECKGHGSPHHACGEACPLARGMPMTWGSSSKGR